MNPNLHQALLKIRAAGVNPIKVYVQPWTRVMHIVTFLVTQESEPVLLSVGQAHKILDPHIRPTSPSYEHHPAIRFHVSDANPSPLLEAEIAHLLGGVTTPRKTKRGRVKHRQSVWFRIGIPESLLQGTDRKAILVAALTNPTLPAKTLQRIKKELRRLAK